jgi:hypothetical protein
MKLAFNPHLERSIKAPVLVTGGHNASQRGYYNGGSVEHFGARM